MNVAEFAYMGLCEVAEAIHRGELTSVAATEAMLSRIAAHDPILGSYACVTTESALEEAAVADQEISRGQTRSRLHGVPLGVKDLFWTANAPTAAGSPIHKDFIAPHDATAVERIRSAGGIILGKLQMTEGAYSDYHPSVKPPLNPWDADYWPGISSSGPAVALAAGLCFGALASDTGGSIRWPSAACGVTGLKPTWGRVSRHGVSALAPSMDHVGVMARSAVDVGIILSVAEGYDDRDPTTLSVPGGNYSNLRDAHLRGRRIGVDRSWAFDDVDLPVRDSLLAAEAIFRNLGAEIVDIKIPDVNQAVADWVPICATEAAVAHKETYPARAAEYGPVLAGVLEAGRALSAIEYHELDLRRMVFRTLMERVLMTVDFMIAPVQPFSPISLKTLGVMGSQPDLIRRLQTFTAPFDLTGHPTLTVPGGYSTDGLPIGIQLVGRNLSEEGLLRAAAVFQQNTNWHRRRCPIAVVE